MLRVPRQPRSPSMVGPGRSPGQVCRVLSPGSSQGLGASAGRSARISRRQLVGQTRPASSENVRPGCAAPSNAEGSAAVLGAQWWMRGRGRPTAEVQGPIRRQARARGRARGVGAAESRGWSLPSTVTPSGHSDEHDNGGVVVGQQAFAARGSLELSWPCDGRSRGQRTLRDTDGGGADHRGEGTTSTARECPGGSGRVAKGGGARTTIADGTGTSLIGRGPWHGPGFRSSLVVKVPGCGC
jgi:hypothetical protein